MDTLSYWTDTLPRGETFYHDQPLPDSADVAIIGGGYTGLSAALHLARAGASVAVLDREHMGWGASGRNGGMVLPGMKHGAEVLIRRYGIEAARAMFEMSLDSIHAVRRIIQQEAIDCDFEETGYIYAASRPGHFSHLAADHRLMAAYADRVTTLLPADRMHEELGTAQCYGALVDDCGGGLHPGKYVMGLARAADRAGATLHDHAVATQVRPLDAGGFEVVTLRGVFRAKEVVIATNGYTRELTPWLQRRVIPLGSYIIVTEPLDPPLADHLIPKRRMVFDSRNLLVYFRVLPDRRMMFGGRVSFVPTTSERSGELLRRRMIEMFPELAAVRVEYSWGGFLGLAFDLMPHAGRQNGMLYSLAYAGHGVAMATYMGMKLAEVISDQSAALPFSDLPFPSWFFYRRKPWFMPLAGFYYRMLDRIA